MIRDGQMDGKRITIYEASNICGGCLDGIKDPKEGYLFRGEREMEDHYECLWDLMRSIPSLDVKDASVLEDFTGSIRTTPTTPCAGPLTSAGTGGSCGHVLIR